jgi:hypothetical protein
MTVMEAAADKPSLLAVAISFRRWAIPRIPKDGPAVPLLAASF